MVAQRLFALETQVRFPLEAIFCSTHIILVANTESDKHWTLKYQSIDGLTIEMLTDIRFKNTLIGFSARKISKQAVAHHTFVASQSLYCLKWWYCCLENETIERPQTWPVMHLVYVPCTYVGKFKHKISSQFWL